MAQWSDRAHAENDALCHCSCCRHTKHGRRLWGVWQTESWLAYFRCGAFRLVFGRRSFFAVAVGYIEAGILCSCLPRSCW